MLVSLHNPNTLKVEFRYSATMLEKIKTLPGRRWNPEKKYWTIPNNDYCVNKLTSWGFSFDSTFQKYSKEKKEKKEKKLNIDINTKLRDYQVNGVNYFASHNGSILLADEQGLGKTIQTIAYINSAKKFPALIVSPSSIKLNWAKEIKKWTGADNSDILILYGKTPDIKNISGYNWVIINYDIIDYWSSVIMNSGFKMMVLDESQNIRNEKTKKCKAILKMSKTIFSRAALSGTPISNRPIELYSTFKYINPTIFPSKFKFGQQFCNMKNNGFGRDYSGSSNTDELNKILTDNFMLRRLKKDVLKDLPEKQKIVLPTEMKEKERKRYYQAETNFIEFLKTNFGKKKAKAAKNAEALVYLNTMRKLVAEAKLDSCKEWIKDFIESGKKLVVFAWHQNVIDSLMQEFNSIAVKIDGGVNAAKRQEVVDKFQNDDNIRLFIGNIKAAGVGITLTEASDTATIELTWSPSDLAQAEDRVHRIGQKNSVNNYYLMCENTIDEKMMNIIDGKQKIIDSVMDGKETSSDSLLSELMKSYMEN